MPRKPNKPNRPEIVIHHPDPKKTPKLEGPFIVAQGFAKGLHSLNFSATCVARTSHGFFLASRFLHAAVTACGEFPSRTWSLVNMTWSSLSRQLRHTSLRHLR